MSDDVELVRQVIAEVMEARKAEFSELQVATDAKIEERMARIETSLQRSQKQGYLPGQKFARATRAFLAAGDEVNKAFDLLRKWGSADIVTEMENEAANRALTVNGPSGIGLMLPEAYSSEMIPLLRPYSVLARRVTRSVSLGNGTLHFPRIASGAMTYWRPPQADVKRSSTATIGRLTLTEKAMVGMSVVPNRVLQVPGINADMWILEDLIAAIGAGLDKAFINGSGDEFEPLGLLKYGRGNNADQVNSFSGGALSSGVLDWTVPVKMMETHISKNGTLVRPGWIFHPTLWRLLMTSTTGTAGFLAWKDEMAQGKILGIDFDYSVNVTVEATSNNPTYCILLDYMEFLQALGQQIQIARSTEATIFDSSGAAYHLFPNNETAIRTIWAGDFGLRQTKSCTVGSGIQTT